MKKTKKIIIVAALVVFALISGIVGYNKVQKKDAKPKGMFAIYIDEGDGNGPVASTSNVWPTNGYELDLETSFCDNGSTLTYDSANKTVGVEAVAGDKCKLYFVKVEDEGLRVISQAGATLTTGDKIALGDENFWVISNTNGTIRALAEYNLYVGNIYNSSCNKVGEISSSATGYGLQNSSAKGYYSGDSQYVGVVAFASGSQHGTDYSSYSGSLVEGYINDYIDYLESEYGVSGISGDAITRSELETLGCSSIFYSCSGAPSWVYTTSYWSGSASDEWYVWRVYSDADFASFDNVCDMGVRPIIEFDESLLN